MHVRSKSVLVFGDSLTHRGSRTAPDGVDVVEGPNRSSAPGDLLASYLLAAGASRARINGRVSRSAWNFFSGANGEDGNAVLAAEVARRPQLVIVFLGTNDLGLNQAKDAQAFVRIRDAFLGAGAELWALGPPLFPSAARNQQAEVVYQTLRSVFGKRVFDLRPLTGDILTTAQGRASDGVHFAAAGAAKLAQRMAAALTTTVPVPLPVTAKRASWAVPGAFAAVGLLLLGSVWLRRRRR